FVGGACRCKSGGPSKLRVNKPPHSKLGGSTAAAAELVEGIERAAPGDATLTQGNESGAQEHVGEEERAEGQREAIERGNAHDDVHADVKTHGDQSGDAGESANPVMAKEHAEQGKDKHSEQAERLGNNQGSAELSAREEIFLHTANQIANACMPAHGNRVLGDGHAGTETAQLDNFPKHNVVDHFQGQAAVGAAGLIGGAFDHLKSADTNVRA